MKNNDNKIINIIFRVVIIGAFFMGTYRTIATYYNYSGQPEKALENLKAALQYVALKVPEN